MHCAPMVEREIAHLAADADAGVIEHVIQAAVGAHGVFHQALDVLGAGDIQPRGGARPPLA